jgi:O-antigen/teichoic acid export membrane protein
MWSVIGAVLSRGFTLLTGIVVARMLGKAGFGMWGLTLGVVAMFAQYAGLGVALTATKHVAELRNQDPIRAGRVLSLLMLIGLISVMLMAIACLSASGWMARRLYAVPELALPLKFASLMVSGMVGTQMVQGAMAGFEDFRGIARINAVHGVVLLVAVLALTFGLGLSGTVIGTALAWSVSLVLSVLATLRASRMHSIPIGLEGIWEERRLIWTYAAPSLLTAVVAAPATVLGMSFVSQTVGGVAGLGALHASLRWRDVILFVPMCVKRITLPILSRLRGEGDRDRFVRAFWANIGVNGGLALAGAVPVALLSRWILTLYGRGFAEDWGLLVLLSCAAVCQAVNDVATQVTACLEKMWWRFFIHVVWAAMVVGGSYALVPFWGVRGYAWALASAIAVHMLLNLGAALVLIRASGGVEKPTGQAGHDS